MPRSEVGRERLREGAVGVRWHGNQEQLVRGEHGGNIGRGFHLRRPLFRDPGQANAMPARQRRERRRVLRGLPERHRDATQGEVRRERHPRISRTENRNSFARH